VLVGGRGVLCKIDRRRGRGCLQDCLQPRVCSGFWANVGRMRLLGLTGWELSPFYSKHYFILFLIVLKPFSIGGRSSPFFIQNIYFIIFDMI
jgi:hypothetical protein